MGRILLLMLGITIVFVLFVVFVGRALLRRMERSVARPHNEADFIMGTGLAPGSWTAGYHRALARLEARGASEERKARLEKGARRRVVRKLQRLQRYFERASIFGDEATRRAMVHTMRTVVGQWKESNLADFAPPGVGPAPEIEE